MFDVFKELFIDSRVVFVDDEELSIPFIWTFVSDQEKESMIFGGEAVVLKIVLFPTLNQR